MNSLIIYLLVFLVGSPFREFVNAGTEEVKQFEDGQQFQGRYLRSAPHVTSITCTVYLFDYFAVSILEGGHEDIPGTYRCVDHENNDKEYKLLYAGNSDEDFIGDCPIFQGKELKSGETVLRISPKSLVDDFSIDLSIKSNKVEVLTSNDEEYPRMNRRLGAKRIGESTVAVFRITTADDEPTKSAAELADDIFGIESDKYNLQSGYRACSGDKLHFYPGEGNGLVDGVFELTLDQATNGVDKDTVDQWVWDKLNNGINFPLWSYDHYMYVMPENVDFEGAAAYACLWCPKSVYYNLQASNYQVLLHEIGHNIGHVHSGKDDGSYNDRTCWMGAHTYWDEGPDACFNAPKSWYFGWYSDRHIEVMPSTESISLKLAGIDDYLNEKTIEGVHHVILRLKEGSEDLYILYNRAKGINRGVRGSANLVTVVEQKGDRQQSWQLGELDAGETYTKPNWNGSGKSLILTVCNMVPGGEEDPDIANIVAYVDDDDGNMGDVSCDGFTFAPTSSPTNTPENLHVSYYAVSLNSLPSEGLGSLTPYDTEYVQNIDFSPGSGSFAGSGRENDVAALFEGYLAFPFFPDNYYFCLTSDDGSKLFIEDELVIDNDVTGNTERCAEYNVTASDVVDAVSKVRVEYFEKGGSSKLILQWVPLSRPPEFRLMTVVDASAFVDETVYNATKSPTASPTTPLPTLENPSMTPSAFPSANPSYNSSGNVYVKYYAVSLDTLPDAGLGSLTPYDDGYVPNIDFQLSGSGGFATSGRNEDVAALFEGYLDFPITDSYYICITSDDGSKLFIEDSLVISNDGLHGDVQKCVTYDAPAGVKHIGVEYFQRGGGATLNLQYVPLSRPPDFMLMRVISPSEFVPKPDDDLTEIPTASPSGSPSRDFSTHPTFLPSLSPSDSSSSSPTVQLSGNVRVHYYEAIGWTSLPPSGLSSLSPYKSEIVDTINYPFTTGNFAGSGRADNVAALFEGTLEVPMSTEPFSGDQTVGFCITSDDGSKLYINGALVISNDGLHSAEKKCTSVGITDSEIEVVVEYFEQGGGSVLILEVSPSYFIVPDDIWV